MFYPAQEDPTVPYLGRPVAGPGKTSAVPTPYAAPAAMPPGLPRMPAMPTGRPGPRVPAAGAPGQENPFDDVLERVERDWSTAIDEGPVAGGAPARPPPPAPPRTPFADHVIEGQSVGRWRDLAGAVGGRLGVPTDVALALVQTVSGGRPDYQAAGGRAVGLAGVPTALAPGVDLRDPTANLTTALARLRSAHDRLGDWDRAALAATGFGDARGEPRVLGEGVDGFRFRDRFRAARQQHAGTREE
jgi:hypothetical protein